MATLATILNTQGRDRKEEGFKIGWDHFNPCTADRSCRGGGLSAPATVKICFAGQFYFGEEEEALAGFWPGRPPPVFLIVDCFQVLSRCYLRPVSGCTSGGCVRAGGATICLGLLTFVLDFANSNRMVWGRSGSNLTPCCKKNWCETQVLVLHSWLGQGGKRDVELRNLFFLPL